MAIEIQISNLFSNIFSFLFMNKFDPQFYSDNRTLRQKVIGDSFPMDLNSMMRLAGQLREKAGPCLYHTFPLLKVRRPPRLHVHRKAPRRPKVSDVKGCSLPICLLGKIHPG